MRSHAISWIWMAVLWLGIHPATRSEGAVRRYLYCAVPGVRNYLEYGGHGLIVFDIDRDYRFVKRIPIGGLDERGRPVNVKGVSASAITDRIYISTLRTLMCLDLRTEKLLWEKSYEGGCDRMALTPDGRVLYLPSLEKHHWHVIDAMNGSILRRIDIHAGAHNTICGLGGRHAYLAGLKSPWLRVVDTRTHAVVKEVGPFSQSIRPFTINRSEALAYVNVNQLLGFEIGDLKSGRVLHRVELQGFQQGPVKRHGCPSHGIGLTPDESEVWVTDAFNRRMHVFDNTVMPPRQKTSVFLRDEPGWITFRLDGRHAWPSTGDVVDVATHRVIGGLKDEKGLSVMGEKIVEIHFEGEDVVRTGDQFGLGRKDE
jgi:DNA-binding beta-propeller fold protein YncE